MHWPKKEILDSSLNPPAVQQINWNAEFIINGKEEFDRINRIMRDWGFSFQSGEGEKISGDVHKKLKYLTHIQ